MRFIFNQKAEQSLEASIFEKIKRADLSTSRGRGALDRGFSNYIKQFDKAIGNTKNMPYLYISLHFYKDLLNYESRGDLLLKLEALRTSKDSLSEAACRFIDAFDYSLQLVELNNTPQGLVSYLKVLQVLLFNASRFYGNGKKCLCIPERRKDFQSTYDSFFSQAFESLNELFFERGSDCSSLLDGLSELTTYAKDMDSLIFLIKKFEKFERSSYHDDYYFSDVHTRLMSIMSDVCRRAFALSKSKPINYKSLKIIVEGILRSGNSEDNTDLLRLAVGDLKLICPDDRDEKLFLRRCEIILNNDDYEFATELAWDFPLLPLFPVTLMGPFIMKRAFKVYSESEEYYFREFRLRAYQVYLTCLVNFDCFVEQAKGLEESPGQLSSTLSLLISNDDLQIKEISFDKYKLGEYQSKRNQALILLRELEDIKTYYYHAIFNLLREKNPQLEIKNEDFPLFFAIPFFVEVKPRVNYYSSYQDCFYWVNPTGQYPYSPYKSSYISPAIAYAQNAKAVQLLFDKVKLPGFFLKDDDDLRFYMDTNRGRKEHFELMLSQDSIFNKHALAYLLMTKDITELLDPAICKILDPAVKEVCPELHENSKSLIAFLTELALTALKSRDDIRRTFLDNDVEQGRKQKEQQAQLLFHKSYTFLFVPEIYQCLNEQDHAEFTATLADIFYGDFNLIYRKYFLDEGSFSKRLCDASLVDLLEASPEKDLSKDLIAATSDLEVMIECYKGAKILSMQYPSFSLEETFSEKNERLEDARKILQDKRRQLMKHDTYVLRFVDYLDEVLKFFKGKVNTDQMNNLNESVAALRNPARFIRRYEQLLNDFLSGRVTARKFIYSIIERPIERDGKISPSINLQLKELMKSPDFCSSEIPSLASFIKDNYSDEGGQITYSSSASLFGVPFEFDSSLFESMELSSFGFSKQ